MNPLVLYIPFDRRHALARGEALPDRTYGSALYADIAGFTPRAESLAQSLGAQRGAEELTRQLNQVYDALISQVHQYHGSVIGFSGDAITCWFEKTTKHAKRKTIESTSVRATACAHAMQDAMRAFPYLAIKIGLATGPARRFIVGDPQIQLIDTLAGETIRQMAHAAELAPRGGIAPDLPGLLKSGASVTPTPWDALPDDALSAEQIRPWVLPALAERIGAGHEHLGTELRTATALFVQFPELDYDHDDDAGKKLDAYIRDTQHILQRHAGSLIQLTLGDKGSYFYAVFGAPIAHDDDPVRAIYAARDLIATFPSPTSIRIGIAQGPMRVGAYGSAIQCAYGAIGDATNLAARLMLAAPVGEILCDYNVYRAASKRIAFEVLAPIRVKGKAGLVRVYRPTHQPSTVVNPPSEMIGRRVEIATIEKILDAVQSGATRVLLIEGEAGIGKSRLVDKLKFLTRERGLTWLIGNGQSIEQHTPYRAWRDVFNSYFDLDYATEPRERRARVTSLVAQLVPEHAPRLPVLDDVLGLDIPENALTQSLDANLRQQNVAVVLTALLRAWTVEHPLVLILEDAHWLDGLSWQLALQVARGLALTNAPLLLVLVNRPLNENSTGQQVFAELRAMRPTQTLTLSALAPDEIVALITHRLEVPPDTLPAPLIELVQARANGNPFFAEELVFNLRDNNILTHHASRITFTQDLSQTIPTLPDTLHGLVLSRLDRLPPQRQFVIKVAAVIGRAFAFAPLHHVVNRYMAMVDETLKEHLASLTQADFTFLESLEPELTYLFKHIITQEAAYQTLLFSQRRELHRIVAEWYENSGEWTAVNGQKVSSLPTVHYPLLAYHYRYAEDAEKERDYLGLAGAAAEKIYANDAAIGFYTRLLALCAPQAQAEILLKRGKVFELVGRWQDAERDYRATLTAPGQIREAAWQVRSYFYLGDLLRQRAQYAQAREYLTQARAIAQSIGAQHWQAASLHALGKIQSEEGDYARAQNHFEQALAIWRETDDLRGQANAFHALGNLAIFQAAYARAAEQYQNAIAIFRALGARPDECNTLNNLGTVALYRGEYAHAANYYTEALRIARETGARRNESNALGNLGIVARYQEDYTCAIAYAEQALAIDRAMGHGQGAGRKLNALGEATRTQGDYARAQAYYTDALAIARALGERRSESIALSNLGLVALDQRDYPTALAHYTDALAIARKLDDRDRIGYTLTGLAEARAGVGQFADAEAASHEAIALRRAVGQMALVMESIAGLARIYLAQDKRTDARDAAQEILTHVEQGQSLDAANEPLRILLTSYHVLASNQDARAPDMLAITFRRLRQRLAHIANLDVRRSVIEQSPWCGEIIAAWVQSTQSSLDQAIDEAMKTME